MLHRTGKEIVHRIMSAGISSEKSKMGAVNCAPALKCDGRSPKHRSYPRLSGSWLTDRRKKRNSVNAKRRQQQQTTTQIERENSTSYTLRRFTKGYHRTLIRLLRQVRQPVLVLRLISFLCLPPDIILPSGGGRG